MTKISKDMWCFFCEHEWEEPDYFNSACKCPRCPQQAQRTYRTDSFSFAYAWEEKHRSRFRKKNPQNQPTG